MVRRSVREAAVARGLDTEVGPAGTDGSGGEAGIRIVLVGDHPLFRDGVRLALQGADGLRVIAEASSRDEAVELLFQRRVGADVVLVDLQMADTSSGDITRTVSECSVSGRSPETPHVIAIGAEPDDDAVVAVLRAGARGYLLKNVAARELVWAIRIVADGGAVFSPPVAERLGAYFSAVHGIPAQAAFPELTNREREILDLIARGMDNRRIASTLVLSNKTVRNHITSLFAKLRVTDRVAAAVRARDAGLG
ncbi:response regulator transcription factor [Streptomyces atrovirens]|uniref:LuxR C-terminal-related transcriptional regulator n=1 Tax=Streptomyces atrovirens TaxID=285556 RepID=A0ABW0DJ32_9ACTN